MSYQSKRRTVILAPTQGSAAQSATPAPGTGNAAFLIPGEAAAYLRVSKGYLAKLRVEGGGPLFVKLAARVILYRPVDLLAYAESRLRSSTTDPEKEANND